MNNRMAFEITLSSRGCVNIDLRATSLAWRPDTYLSFSTEETKRDIELGIAGASGKVGGSGRMFHVNAAYALKAGLFELLAEGEDTPMRLTNTEMASDFADARKGQLAVARIRANRTGSAYSIYFDTPDPFWDVNVKPGNTYYLRLATYNGTLWAQETLQDPKSSLTNAIPAASKSISIYRRHRCIQLSVKASQPPPTFHAVLRAQLVCDISALPEAFPITITTTNTSDLPITVFTTGGGGIATSETFRKLKIADVTTGEGLVDPAEAMYCSESASGLGQLTSTLKEYLPTSPTSETLYLRKSESGEGRKLISQDLEENHVYSIRLRRLELPGWRYGRIDDVERALSDQRMLDWYTNGQGRIKVVAKPEEVHFKAIKGQQWDKAIIDYDIEQGLRKANQSASNAVDKNCTTFMSLGAEQLASTSLIDTVKQPAPVFTAAIERSSNTCYLSAGSDPITISINYTNRSRKPVTLFRSNALMKTDLSASAHFHFDIAQQRDASLNAQVPSLDYAWADEEVPSKACFITIRPDKSLSYTVQIARSSTDGGQIVFEHRTNLDQCTVQPNYEVLDRVDKWAYGTTDEVAGTPEQRLAAKDWDQERDEIWMCWQANQVMFTAKDGSKK